MTQIFDDEGNITSLVGDTILFDINGVPTDLDYTIFFRVYDKDNNTIIPEAIIPANYNDTVTIEVKPYVTDMVIVPSGKKSVTYFYGIKACNFENQVEHTQTVDNVDLEQETKITFLRKRVEGFYYYGTLYPWESSGGVTVYTNTLTPVQGTKIYTSSGFLTSDTVSSVTTVGNEVASIVVSGVTYNKIYDGTLYPWISESETLVYTTTLEPAVNSKVYTAAGVLTALVSSVTTEDDEVTAIVVSGVTYNKPEPEPADTDDDSDSDVDSDTDTD